MFKNTPLPLKTRQNETKKKRSCFVSLALTLQRHSKMLFNVNKKLEKETTNEQDDIFLTRRKRKQVIISHNSNDVTGCIKWFGKFRMRGIRDYSRIKRGTLDVFKGI